MSAELALRGRVRIRMRARNRPHQHQIEEPLVVLQGIGLYGWHYYGFTKRVINRPQVWFSEREVRGR
jgi:hypothetical protein